MIMMKTILACAALTAVVGCRYASDETWVRMFPEPFGNVHFGMPETAFTNVWTEAAYDTNSVDGAWWTFGKVGRFEDAAFRFTPTAAKSNMVLSSAMLNYQHGTTLREVLAEAESRLGPSPSYRTTMYCGALCFERTWRFERGEATLIFYPWSTGMGLQWRIDETGPSSAHDDFAMTLPSNIVKGVRAGFRVENIALADIYPSGRLSVKATSRLFTALAGWESFDPFDLETLFLKGDGKNFDRHGFWLIGDYLYFVEGVPIVIGEDAEWVANLGVDGVARTIPESRRWDIIDALHDLWPAPDDDSFGWGYCISESSEYALAPTAKWTSLHYSVRGAPFCPSLDMLICMDSHRIQFVRFEDDGAESEHRATVSHDRIATAGEWCWITNQLEQAGVSRWKTSYQPGGGIDVLDGTWWCLEFLDGTNIVGKAKGDNAGPKNYGALRTILDIFDIDPAAINQQMRVGAGEGGDELRTERKTNRNR